MRVAVRPVMRLGESGAGACRRRIAARTNNREGIAGICWTCSVLAVKVLGADGTGDTALVSAGIVRAVDSGARVISMSLGGPSNDQTLAQAVSYALAKGVIVVAAAGNNGTSTPFYPAALPGVLSVAGTDETDHLYSWSNFGSWVQVAAPGCNPAPSSSGGYVLFCGTSSAAPVVAGLVALALSQQPNAGRDAIVDALERSAVPVGGAVRFGRVDADAALTALGAPSTQASPAAAPPTAVSSHRVTLRSALRTGTALLHRSFEGGTMTATLRFGGPRVLTLAIRDGSGKLVARTRGRSALRIVRQLPAGRYTFAVHGAKTRRVFTLELSETSA